MRDQETLPQDLLWQADGHVTDVVLDSMADSQDEVVPTVVQNHVRACDLCSQRLGDAVNLTFQVGAALDAAMATRAAQPKGWPIPIPALLAATLLAALGTVPTFGELIVRMAELARSIFAVLPNLTRAAVALSRSDAGNLGTHLTLLSLASLALLLVGAFAIARTTHRQAHLQGRAR